MELSFVIPGNPLDFLAEEAAYFNCLSLFFSAFNPFTSY